MHRWGVSPKIRIEYVHLVGVVVCHPFSINAVNPLRRGVAHTNKAFTAATTDATKATAVASGSTVIRIAAGIAQIVTSTEDGNNVATHTVTVS